MRVCHLLARDTTEDDLTTVGQLLRFMGKCRFEQYVASVDGPTADRARAALGVDVRRVCLRFGGYVGSLRQDALLNGRPDLMHVWSKDPAPINSLAGADETAVVISKSADATGGRRPSKHAQRVLDRAIVICDSDAARQRLVESGHDPSRCQLVPPAVEADDDRRVGPVPTREAMGLSEDQPVLLTSGPPSRQGGHYYAVWAAALLQQLHPDVRLIVPGDSAERNRLERFAHGFALPQLLVCSHDRWTLVQLARVADVMLAPVEADLPTGPIVRAMAAGVPVIAGDVPAMREVIDDGRTGLLVPPRNATRLAGAAIKIFEDAALAERLTQSARERVLAEYRVAFLVEQIADVYERALGLAKTLAMGR